MLRKLLVGLALLAALSALGALYLSWSERRVQAELVRVDGEMSEGFFHAARLRLDRLARSWPSRPEIALRRGQCALALGRPKDALDALAAIAPGTSIGTRAAALRADLLLNRGHYAEAESVLVDALARDPSGWSNHDALRILSRIYRFEGRVSDVRRVLRIAWPHAPDPAAALKELWHLDASPVPIEALGDAYRKADPQDDRVWLGRANLALLTGKPDEASTLIDACLKRRAADPAVWRARLDLALATGNTAVLREAAGRLSGATLERGEWLAIRAQVASWTEDPSLQRRELSNWLAEDPFETHALQQLAVLEGRDGEARQAAALRERKSAVDRAHDAYRKMILDAADLTARAEQLESLSRAMGRRFDAEAWALIRRRGKASGPVGSAPEATPRPDEPDAPGSPRLLARIQDVLPGAGTLATRAGSPRVGNFEFRDDAEAAGLRFTFENGETALRQLPETMSGGVALLDYDGDGWLDVFVVQGGPCREGDPDRPSDRLFRNRRDGTFEDATEASGIAVLPRGYGVGVAVGDIDNDGDPDLFLSRLRTYVLLRNRGDGTFEDATRATGLAGVRDNPTSAALADLDNDGDLDLYVCHYMVWDPANPTLCPNDKGGYFYCDPSKVLPAPDHVFRNDAGRFTDVTTAAGFVDPGGRGLGVVAAHLDDDNLIDLFVANDGTANYLFKNLGGFRFEEVAQVVGAAGNGDGGYQAGMGVACGDLDGDGRPEVLVTNFYGEGTTLYQNLGGGLFTDRSTSSGLASITKYLLGFGIAILDADADGHRDVIQVNGHVNDNRPSFPYAMPARLMAGGPDGRFVDVSGRAGPPWSVARVGRGLATGDLDRDGRVDALVLAQNQPLAYLHNRTASGHWVSLQLVGRDSNRDAVGARVTLTSGGRKQVLERIGGGSYQSAGDGRLHFGLGNAMRVDDLEVRWPSGRVEHRGIPRVDRAYRIVEGDPELREQAGLPGDPTRG